jgi:hypothetical protein
MPVAGREGLWDVEAPRWRWGCQTYAPSYPCNRQRMSVALRDVEAPKFSRQSTHRWRWGCQPYAPSYARNRPWMPVGLRDVDARTFSRQSAHRRLRLSALCAGRLLPPGRFLVLISVKGWVDLGIIVRLEGLDQLKNPVTSSGIESATFRFVA